MLHVASNECSPGQEEAPGQHHEDPVEHDLAEE